MARERPGFRGRAQELAAPETARSGDPGTGSAEVAS